MITTANIATFATPNGDHPRKKQLLTMLKSIEGQFNKVRLYYNGVKTRPAWVPSWVEVEVGEDLTDIGKFYFVEEGAKEYYFTLDDDILYPPNYAKDTVAAIQKNECIVTYHGRNLIPTATDYYRTNPAFRCLAGEPKNKFLMVPGTGVTAFDTRYFNATNIKNSPVRKASDLVAAIEIAKQGLNILGLKHGLHYFRYLEPPIETTIHQVKHRDQADLIEMANEVKRLRGVR